MEYNINWPRWIKSSIAKHFEPKSEDYKLFVEGFTRNTAGLKEWVELRVDGPYIEEVTKGHWKLDVEINTLITITPTDNVYRMERLIGYITETFIECLEIYRLGNTEEDDGTYLGCFKLKTRGREKLIVTNFGKVRPDTEIYQSSIEGHFEMYLDD